MTSKTKEKVLVLGGGFGGIKTCLELVDDRRFEVSLLTDSDQLRYYPTLYQTATGAKRANSSVPLDVIFKNKPIKIIKATAKTIDRKQKQIIDDLGQRYSYDTLVISLGVVTNYFNIPGLAEYSFGIKSQEQVQKFKDHIHNQLIDDHRTDLNYVIVGAGPTGIELAGSLPAYLKRIIQNHGLKHQAIHIDLIEAAPRLLPRLPKKTSQAVKKRLRHLGIKLYLSSIVQGESIDELTVNNKPIRSHTVIWTAGVTNHPFFNENKFVIMGRNKVAVDTFLQAEENIFVIGDNANTPYSGTAQTALRDGIFIAANLKRRINGQNMKSYVAKPPITVIPVGPHWATVVWGNLKIYGLLGWLLRELADLIGFHDLEPWKTASKQWIQEFSIEERCPICAEANKR